MKEWACQINLSINQFGIEAETEEDFIEAIKDMFMEEYNIVLNDNEITNVKQIISELETTKIAERSGRAMDHESEDAFERLRVKGYM